MRRKITLVLSMFLLILTLGACGKTDPTTVDYNGYSYSELENQLLVSADTVLIVYDQILPMNGIPISSLENKDMREALMNDLGLTEELIDAVVKWDEVSDEFGICSEVKEDSFNINKAGNTLTTNVTLIFEDEKGIQREVLFEMVYDYHFMEITGITIEPVYSLGEKLQKAGINTAISMSVVFCVLILISLIIYAFNIFPYIEKKRQTKTSSNNESKEQVVEQIKQREEQQLMDDTELIAVIAAAIAASEGTSTSDFVVRSINRR